MRITRRSGFTLVELAVATLALGSIGYVLTFALKASADSQREITTRASEHRIVRSASRALLDELGSAGEETIVFGKEAHAGAAPTPTLRFQLRIEEGGEGAFGVTHLGVVRTGWSIVYAIEEPVGASDARRLVRRIESEEGVVQSSQIVARGLCAADAEPPGFLVETSGDLWQVTISTEGVGGRTGVEEVFHVRARN